MTSYYGAGAALCAAFLWAVSTALWKRFVMSYDATAVNLFKCTVGSVFLTIAMLIFPSRQGLAAAWSANGLILALSGVIGLALGDLFLFRAYARLGAQSAAVMNQMTPIWTAILGAAFLHEKLSWTQYIAIPVIALGVAFVILGRRPDPAPSTPGLPAQRRNLRQGVISGLAASLCNAIGFLLSKPAVEVCGALPASWVRVTSATILLLFLARAQGSLTHSVAPVFRVHRHGRELLAVFLGTVLGIFLAQSALRLLPASVAASLCSTTPLFLFPMAVHLLRERYRALALFGTLLAIAGVPFLLRD